MKRIGYIFDEAFSIENLRAAHFEGKQMKKKKRCRSRMRRALAWEADLENNLLRIQKAIYDGTYRPGEYFKKPVYEAGKWREIWYTKEWDDQVAQRAVQRTLGVKLEHSMIPGTYASMKGRGIHRALRHLRRLIIRTPFATELWAHQSDFRKCYDSILHEILKYKLEQKIKDTRMLLFLFVYIDSFPCEKYLKEHPNATPERGIPIGNILSPLFANFFLDDFDHWAKEVFKAMGYFRYADDILGIFRTKDEARDFHTAFHRHMDELDLTIKPNEQIYPIKARKIDFLGYLISTFSVRLRKRNERSFRRNVHLYKKHPTKKLVESLSSRWGWIKHISKAKRFWFAVLKKSVKQINKEALPC